MIKVIWGRSGTTLLARDVDGVLVNKMNTHRRRRVPEVRGRVRRVHPRALLRSRPAPAADGRAPLRRRAAAAAARRARLPQALRRLQDRGRARGRRPTVILAKTIKGWTLGPDFEARNATHQIKKMTTEQLRIFRDRLRCTPRSPRRRSTTGDPPYSGRRHRLARVRVHDGAAARARRRDSPSASSGLADRSSCPRDAHVHRGHRRHGREGAGVHHDGVRPAPAQPAARPRLRPARRADHPRRGAHVRHRRAVPRVQDLRAVRPALRAGRRRAAALVPRGERRPDPRGGHHRGRRDGVASPPRARATRTWRADDPVLHLLFDVRVPARRRPDLVVGDQRGRGFLLGATAAARRSPARGCSTATARASCSRPPCRTAGPTTPRSRTRWR